MLKLLTRIKLSGLVLAAFMIVAVAQGGYAQGLPEQSVEPAKPTLPAELTEAAIRDAVAKMDDLQVRQMLIERLDAVVAAENAKKSATPLGEFVVSLLAGVGGNIAISIERLPTMFGGVARGIGNFFGPKSTMEVLQFFGIMLAAFITAYAVGYASDRLVFSAWRDRIKTANPHALGETLQTLGIRFSLDIASLVVFSIVIYGMLRLLMPAPSDLQAAWSAILYLCIMVLAAAAISRFLVAPERPDLRLVTADDETAKFFHRHLLIIVFIAGLLDFFLVFLLSNGIPLGELRLGFWINLALYLWILQMVWRGRKGVVDILIGGNENPTPGQLRVARAWPYVTMGLVVANWLLIEFIVAAGRFDMLDGQENVTLAFILFAPAIDTAIRGLVRHIAPPMQGAGALAELAHERTKQSYVRIGRVLLTVFGIAVIAKMWGIDLDNLASAGLGAQIASGIIEIIMFLASGYIVWEIATLWVNRKLAGERTAAGIDLEADEATVGEVGGQGGSRLSTVLPLILSVVQVTIIVLTVLLALSQIGIDITPLLAGAGIVGLAIGFGAQALVRDVVSGVFFLFDDAFRTGEYIEVGDTRGTVEKISIRSVQLRHHRGAVHTVPYGEIPKVTNQSRDWAIMKLRFTVPFDTDTDKVRKIFKRIGQDLLADEELGEDFLQPFKSQGVLEFDDVGIVLRGKFMAKPGKQFTLRKEIFKRVQQAFDENGIEFARKEVRVRVPDQPDGEKPSPEELRTLAAAAAEAQNESETQPSGR